MSTMQISSSKSLPDTSDVADHQYSKEDYEGSGQVEQGTAVTHEQISDMYMSVDHTEDTQQAE